jgi:hypothetical protein
MGKKKPDMVVEQPQTMEYPTNVGAPAFLIPDLINHKNEKGVNALNYFGAKFDEIKKQYDELMELANDTETVYNSKYNFIPTVGKIYHLYKSVGNKCFLSIIEPNEWSMDHKGSFKFTSDSTWERQK